MDNLVDNEARILPSHKKRLDAIESRINDLKVRLNEIPINRVVAE